MFSGNSFGENCSSGSIDAVWRTHFSPERRISSFAVDSFRIGTLTPNWGDKRLRGMCREKIRAIVELNSSGVVDLIRE
jgi:hypothetical protein